MTYVLWVVQVLLALLFLFAGVSKLIMSIEEMTRDIHLPGTFLRFIGVVEILGAIGLILPSWLRIRPGLTPLSAPLFAAEVAALEIAASDDVPVIVGPLLDDAEVADA